MSYDVTKLTQLAHLKSLAEKVAAECATKTELQALSSKVDGLVSAGGEANVLEGVKVNGTALSIAEKMVDLVIASGTTNGTILVNNADVAVKGLAALAYKAQVSQSDLDSALNAVIAAKAEQSAVTSLQGEITTLKGSGEVRSRKRLTTPSISLRPTFRTTMWSTPSRSWLTGQRNTALKLLRCLPASRRTRLLSRASRR